jgi:hypothetical protein
MAYTQLTGGTGVGGDYVTQDPVTAAEMTLVRDNFDDHETRIAAAESDITTAQGDITDHETRITTVEGQLRVTTVTLTDAQVKALPTTPITLVAAPGSGQRIVPLLIDLLGSFAGGAYTNIDTTDAALVAQLGGVDISSRVANNSTESLTDLSSLLGTAAKTQATLVQWAPTDVALGSVAHAVAAATTLINAALTLTVDNNGAGVLTGGNGANTLKATVFYSVVAS